MSTKDRGFASMDPKKKEEISQKGGHARKDEIGPEGYSEMGKKGGEARRNQQKGDESRSQGSSGDAADDDDE